jgi:hypothetical protein
MRAIRNVILLSVVPAAAITACSMGGGPAPVPSGASSPASSAAAPGPGRGAALPAPQATPSSYVCNGGFPSFNVPFGPNVPPDVNSIINQKNADCFAWWEFISLNWPAPPAEGGVDARGFGDPYDTGPVVWETYMDSNLVFLPDGGPPPAWGSQPELPPSCAALVGANTRGSKGVHFVSAASKFNTFIPPSGTGQAAPRDEPNWLGAQNGKNVWYEVRMSRDEYNYINDNGLYNANTQAAWVADGGGKQISLPQGCSPDAGQTCDGGAPALGSIEIKAAWMEVPDYRPLDGGGDPRWQRYKLTQAFVVDPTTQNCRQTTLALVGLHIIHKTTTQPTWVWATFEQVDNVPDTQEGEAPYGNSFYNPSCKSQVVTAANDCLPDAGPADGSTSVTVSCAANTSPPYELGPGCPAPAPIQTTRQFPIDSTAATPVNQTSAAAIKNYQANSVWQYYRLIDVLWSSSPYQQSGPPITTPHPFNSQESGGVNVANTILETYLQKSTCLDCHKYAAIAPNAKLSSDFSFLFQIAGPPPASSSALRSAKGAGPKSTRPTSVVKERVKALKEMLKKKK